MARSVQGVVRAATGCRLIQTLSATAIVMLFAGSMNSLCAQENVSTAAASPATHYWINAGVGVGSLELSAVVSASLARERHLFSVRRAQVSTLLGDPLWDVGLLYGRAHVGGRGTASIAGGISLVNVIHRSGTELVPVMTESISMGIPIELQLFWRRGVFGLGGYAFTNFNLEEPFWGVALALQLGNRR